MHCLPSVPKESNKRERVEEEIKTVEVKTAEVKTFEVARRISRSSSAEPNIGSPRAPLIRQVRSLTKELQDMSLHNEEEKPVSNPNYPLPYGVLDRTDMWGYFVDITFD